MKQDKEQEKELQEQHGRGLFSYVGGFLRSVKRFFKWYFRLYKGASWWKKTLLFLASFIVFILIYIFAVSVNLFWLFGKSPSLSDIMHPKNAEASEIYSDDGVLIGKFYKENRSNVPYDSINAVFFDALISTEDERFYQHHGIDFFGIMAAGKDAVRGKARGASTITQQLVKNMFRVRSQYSTGLLGKVPGLGIVIMKSKEMIIATELELTNSKKDILQMYANTVDYGSNAFGIKTACKTYFNTTPEKLHIEEAAVLVGLLKATSAYNPRINPEKSRMRRNVVLENMQRLGKISAAECDSLKKLPIRLNFQKEDAQSGSAQYFKEAVVEYIKEKCPELNPYEDGLKIITTLDSKMQRYAEEAVLQHMKQAQRNFFAHWQNAGEPWRDENGRVIQGFLDTVASRTDVYKILSARHNGNLDSIHYYMSRPHKVTLFSYDGPHTAEMSSMDSIKYMLQFLHAGFMAMEPQTGFVKAWVGDVDYKTWNYDKVKSKRQTGSTFKLFVYAAAMEHGFVPSDTRRDEPISIKVFDDAKGEETAWKPSNANGRYSGLDIPLRTAFARSINTIAVKLGQEVGIPNVIKTAQDLGVWSALSDKPSMVLGTSDVSLFEMTEAYAAIANGGMRTAPVLVSKIYNREGKLVYEERTESTRAVSPRTAFYLQKMLQAGVGEAGGTSAALKSFLGSYYADEQIEAGGKTGTTNNYSDAWFIGVTPALVGGAWVGGEYHCIHFRTADLGQGSRLALPIFGIFMQKVLSNSQLRKRYLQHFPAPDVSIDPSSYQGASPFDVDTLEVDSLSVDSVDLLNLMEFEDEQTDDDRESSSSDRVRQEKQSRSEQEVGEQDLFN